MNQCHKHDEMTTLVGYLFVGHFWSDAEILWTVDRLKLLHVIRDWHNIVTQNHPKFVYELRFREIRNIDKDKDLKRNIGMRDDVCSRARLVNER